MGSYRRTDRRIHQVPPLHVAFREVRHQSFEAEMDAVASGLRDRLRKIPALPSFDDTEAVKDRRGAILALWNTLQAERARYPKGSPSDKAYQGVLSEIQAEAATLKDLLRKRNSLAAAYKRQSQTEWSPDNPISLIAALHELVHDVKRGTGYRLDEDDEQLMSDANEYVQRHIHEVGGGAR